MVPIRQGRSRALSPDNGLGRMLLVSLGIHIVVAVLFAVGAVPSAHRDLRPVYTVDLTSLPVKNPQAGRSDARPAPKVEAEAPPQAPPEPKPAPEPPKAKAEAAPVPPPPPEPKAVPKPEPKPAPAKAAREPAAKPVPEKVEKTNPAKSDDSYAETLRKMAEMKQKQQRQQEAEDVSKTIEAMRGRDSRGGSNAPVGMPNARGTEAGVDKSGIGGVIQENWSFSKYQGRTRDIEATFLISYDSQGNLIDYKLVKGSGDPGFDDSVLRAILKTKQVPYRPGERFEIRATFNLKDMRD